jgi:hypothetical protein
MAQRELGLSMEQFDPRFKLFFELMSKKVREILLISSPYDASVMEEDCRLSEAIVSEYRGLNLSAPPRLNWVSSADAALAALDTKTLDLVIIMPRIVDANVLVTAERIRQKVPSLPIILLCHHLAPSFDDSVYSQASASMFNRVFVWRGNTALLLAMIKNTEDGYNVERDTASASIRVIICVEDSPEYLSALLPLFYRELVTQTQAVMEEGLNNEHRLMAMRARPKILVAGTFEEAVELFIKYKHYVLGVFSDVRFPRDNKLDENAGVDFLKMVKAERFDIPLLLMSSDPENEVKAAEIGAVFVDKNSPTLLSEVHTFFQNHLGFGDFVFRSPSGSEIARATNLRMLEKKLCCIPDESFAYHCNRNDFSRWLFARSEIDLACRMRPVRDDDFSDIQSHREFVISEIHQRRTHRQKGVVVDFDPKVFDEDTEIFKIGTGSLGGKARGLSFVSSLLRKQATIDTKFGSVEIVIPQTLVITTEVFDAFIEANGLRELAETDLPDGAMAARFMESEFPEEVRHCLADFLLHFKYPLAVRSSSLLEDAQFTAYAGLYNTYMLPNNDPDLGHRLAQLVDAIKMVYASTYFQAPKAFSKRVGNRTEEEKMAVMVQRLVGHEHGKYFYPTISGVAQTHNYYPWSRTKPEEGIATIALGLGKTVMGGEKALRFSPAHPEALPQRSSVGDVLENSQRFFYALKLDKTDCVLGVDEFVTLERRDVTDALDDESVRLVSSFYSPDDHCLRDFGSGPGFPVVTFAQILKYNRFPLAEILREVSSLGQTGIGCPAELEFCVDVSPDPAVKPQFAILQLRPMSAAGETANVDISEQDLEQAFCVSKKALGNRINTEVRDIVFVKPECFDPKHTPEIARQIGTFNALLTRQGRNYVLIGPGRWGSADRWLGIPVGWADICGAGAIVEAAHPKMNVEPSQGAHFFHNIISLGVNYFTVKESHGNRFDWDWLMSLPTKQATDYVAWVSLERTLTIKVDGRKSEGVLIYDGQPSVPGAGPTSASGSPNPRQLQNR